MNNGLRKGEEMEQHPIRLLKAEEIECRVSSVSEKGISLLLYKDARVDQRILDETFGPFGWKRSHQCIDGNLYCTVEVFDRENNCWVAKQDVGSVGNYEKEKSLASDSFKRACFNWGIGRELYTAPFIWIPANYADIRQKDGKLYCQDHFSVSSISYNGSREISQITIVNDSKNRMAVYESHAAPANSQAKADQNAGKGRKQNANTQTRAHGAITGRQLSAFQSELKRTGVEINAVKERYGFKEPQDMPAELYDRVMRALAKTKSSGGVA